MACMQTLYSSRRLCLRETLNKNILTLLTKNVAPFPSPIVVEDRCGRPVHAPYLMRGRGPSSLRLDFAQHDVIPGGVEGLVER